MKLFRVMVVHWVRALRAAGQVGAAVLLASAAHAALPADDIDAQGSTKACQPGHTVTLKAKANARFVTADIRQPDSPLLAEATLAQAWEDFTLVDAGDGWVALKALSNARYVSANLSSGAALVAGWATAIDGWEKFKVESTADGHVTLKSFANGNYVTVNTGGSGAPLSATSATRGRAEKFTCARATAPQGATVWGGANTWFLYAQRSADRLAILDAMQRANLRVARVFVRAVQYNEYGQIDYVPNLQVNTNIDVETVNGYDDAVLARIDQLMVEAKQRGIKLILSLHDRWYMGSWEGDDIYTQLYGVRDGSQALHDYYDAWAGAEMMQRLDARLRHLLTHRNPLLGNRTWGEMSDVVFSVEAENEAMAGVSGVDDAFAGAWQCARAKAMKPHVSNGVLISTGGVKDAYNSAYSSFFDCPEIDLIGIHNYGKGDDVPGQLQKVLALAKSKNKRVVMQEFSCDPAVDGAPDGLSDAQKRQWRATCNENEIIRYEQLGLPWMIWSVVTPSDTLREVDASDASWPVLSRHATSPPQLGFAWPELK